MNDALQVILQHMDLSDARVRARAMHWHADWHWYAFRRLGNAKAAHEAMASHLERVREGLVGWMSYFFMVQRCSTVDDRRACQVPFGRAPT